MEPIKIIIAGGREFTDWPFLFAKCNDTIALLKYPITIFSGACDRGELTFTRTDGTRVFGADGLGERYAMERGFKIRHWPALWKKHGLKAGPLRNSEMANDADMLIAFWDGESRGTKDIIDRATRKQLLVKIITYGI